MAGRVWPRNAFFRRRLLWTIAGIAVALIAAIAGALQSAGPPLIGRAYVIDGDTLRLGSTRIRLTGIDAPEFDQTCTNGSGSEWSCGMDAKDFLERLVRGHTLTCTRTGRDRYGRALARCTDDGADIALSLVAAGWATTEFDYAGAQASARAAGLGIWSGPFLSPADWRRNHGTEFPGFWEFIRGWFQ